MCECISTIVFYAFCLSCLLPASFGFQLFFPLYELIEFIFHFSWTGVEIKRLFL